MNKKQKEIEQISKWTDKDCQEWYNSLPEKEKVKVEVFCKELNKAVENCTITKYRFDYDRNLLINEYGKTYKVIHANIFQRIYAKLFCYDVLAIYWHDDLAIIKIIGNKAYIIKKVKNNA